MSKVVICIANKEEYDSIEDILSNYPEFNVLITGCGKTRSTYELTKYLIDHPETTHVFNIGLVGSINGLVGDFCIDRVVQGDVDLSVFGYKEGQLWGTLSPFFNLKTLIPINKAGCCTTDKFVNSFERKAQASYYDTRLVDMELGALAHVCQLENKKLYAYKVVSDSCQPGQYSENINIMRVYQDNLRSALDTLKERTK